MRDWDSLEQTAKLACHMPLMLALRRQQKGDLCEFDASLVYMVNSCLNKEVGEGKNQKRMAAERRGTQPMPRSLLQKPWQPLTSRGLCATREGVA